jgi:hypothetical protein
LPPQQRQAVLAACDRPGGGEAVQIRSCNARLPMAIVRRGPINRPTNNIRGVTMATQPTPKGAWKITFLLFLFMLVNFADKIVVGLAGVPIMTELKLVERFQGSNLITRPS